jgi:hypothetical protein
MKRRWRTVAKICRRWHRPPSVKRRCEMNPRTPRVSRKRFDEFGGRRPLMGTTKVNDSALSKHAVAIRKIGRGAAADIVKIGKRLTACKRICGHGNWLPWLEREFGWSAETARKFMRAFEFARRYKFQQSWNMANSALHLLANPATSEAARGEFIARAQAGVPISAKAVKAFVAQARASRGRASEPVRVDVRYERPERMLTSVHYEAPERTLTSVRCETPEVAEPVSRDLPFPLFLREIQNLATHLSRSRSAVADAVALIERMEQQRRDGFIEALNAIQQFAEAVKDALRTDGLFEEEPPPGAA